MTEAPVAGAAGLNARADAPARAALVMHRPMPKPWRTAQARVSLAGYQAELLDGDDGRPMLIVSRWALTRSFRDIDEANAWIARVVGQPAPRHDLVEG